jgi:hypothetical protein
LGRRCRRERHHSITHSFTFLFVCVSLVDDSLYSKAAPFSVWCVHLAVLGTLGGGLASSAHEWLLQRLAAVTKSTIIFQCLLHTKKIQPLEYQTK